MGTGALTANLWRRVAAALSHVPGVEVEVVLSDGSTLWVGDDADVTGGPSVDAIRGTVVEALSNASGSHVQVRLPLAEGDVREVSRVMVRGTATRSVERGIRWRHSCSCRVTDYALTELDVEDALAFGNSVLAEVLDAPWRHFWARRDNGLGVTVLAFDWPPELSEAQEASVEQGLRDLSVMCRIRAGVTEP